MDIRPIQEGDYEEFIEPLWKGWGNVAPEKDFLPDCGFIVFDEVPVAAGYVYVTNSKAAWIEWIVTNINYTDKENRNFALHLLMDTLINLCQMNGFKYIFAIVKNESLINLYQEAGFTKGGEGFEMFKKLNN